jgi:hypothetical protein
MFGFRRRALSIDAQEERLRQESAKHLTSLARSKCSAEVRQELARVWRVLIEDSGERIPTPYRTLIPILLGNAGCVHMPEREVNLAEDWEGIPAWRVMQLARWTRDFPVFLWTFVAVLAAGGDEGVAWSVAENV